MIITGFDIEIDQMIDQVRGNQMLRVGVCGLHLELQLIQYLIKALPRVL